MANCNALKAGNEAKIKAWGGKVNPTLPLIEEEKELHPQTAKSIAIRAIVLGHVARLGFGAPAEQMLESIKQYNLESHLSHSEQALFAGSELTKQQRVNATWRIECINALAWCIGVVDDLNPLQLCGEDLAGKFPEPFEDPTAFIAKQNLRAFDEIMSQADLHYRLHWAARDARLNGTDCPFSESIISERRKAIDWSVGVESDWDEVPLDT